MDALVFENVSHAYGATPAVREVNLRLAQGEILCLLGPSGCGKTTVLRLAAGLEPLQAGRVTLNEQEVARPGRSLPPEARGVGLVFQDYALFPHLTVADNVAFGLTDLPQSRRREIVAEMLERVGLADRAGRYPHLLSGGEQQRVALARALAPKPALLLLDEPFSGLDIRLRQEVRNQTLRVLADAGISTLLVTHDPEEAMYMADRIAVMRDGRIVQTGAPVDVYRDPASAFVTAFLGEVNWLHGTVRAGRVESPLGALAADGLGDGTRVDVLIRPEGLRIDGAAPDAEAVNGAVAAEVTAVRVLGYSSVLDLRVLSDGPALRARLPGLGAPRPGTRVALSLDESQTFIFPCSALDGVAWGQTEQDRPPVDPRSRSGASDVAPDGAF